MTLHAVRGKRVADVMVRFPKTHGSASRLEEIRVFFEDDHVHMALIVTVDGRLVTTIERPDLAAAMPGSAPAAELGTLAGRTARQVCRLAGGERPDGHTGRIAEARGRMNAVSGQSGGKLSAGSRGRREADRELAVAGPRVVIGVDGSADSVAALLWAAREACRRGAALHIVSVWEGGSRPGRTGEGSSGHGQGS